MDPPASGDRGAIGAGKCAAFGSVGMRMVSIPAHNPPAAVLLTLWTPYLTAYTFIESVEQSLYMPRHEHMQ